MQLKTHMGLSRLHGGSGFRVEGVGFRVEGIRNLETRNFATWAEATQDRTQSPLEFQHSGFGLPSLWLSVWSFNNPASYQPLGLGLRLGQSS